VLGTACVLNVISSIDRDHPGTCSGRRQSPRKLFSRRRPCEAPAGAAPCCSCSSHPPRACASLRARGRCAHPLLLRLLRLAWRSKTPSPRSSQRSSRAAQTGKYSSACCSGRWILRQCQTPRNVRDCASRPQSTSPTLTRPSASGAEWLAARSPSARRPSPSGCWLPKRVQWRPKAPHHSAPHRSALLAAAVGYGCGLRGCCSVCGRGRRQCARVCARRRRRSRVSPSHRRSSFRTATCAPRRRVCETSGRAAFGTSTAAACSRLRTPTSRSGCAPR
jgi:hypothetical protein